MSRKNITLTLLAFFIIGFLGFAIYTSIGQKELIASLKGDLYYLKRNENHALELWKSEADLSKPTLIASNNDQTNSNIISYEIEKDGKISYIAMKNGEWAKWEVAPSSEEKPKLIDPVLESNEIKFMDYKFMDYKNITNPSGKLFSSKGSIMLEKPSGEVEELLHFYGIYDSKFSSGFVNPQWSPDGKYITFSYNGYRSPFTSIAGSILANIILNDDHNGQIYIVEYKSNNYYKYLKGSSLLWF